MKKAMTNRGGRRTLSGKEKKMKSRILSIKAKRMAREYKMPISKAKQIIGRIP